MSRLCYRLLWLDDWFSHRLWHDWWGAWLWLLMHRVVRFVDLALMFRRLKLTHHQDDELYSRYSSLSGMFIWLIILHLSFNLTNEGWQSILIIFIKHAWDLLTLLFTENSVSDISHSLTWHSVVIRQCDGQLLLHKTSQVQEEHKVFRIIRHGEELREQVHFKAILFVILYWGDEISTCLDALPLLGLTSWLLLHDLVHKYRKSCVLDQTWLGDDTVHTRLLHFGKHGSIQVLYQMQGLSQVGTLSSDASGVKQAEEVGVHWLVVHDLASRRDEGLVDLTVLLSWVEDFWIDPVLVTTLVLGHDTAPSPSLQGLLLGSLVVQQRTGL